MEVIAKDPFHIVLSYSLMDTSIKKRHVVVVPLQAVFCYVDDSIAKC